MRLIDADEFDDLIFAEQMKYADDKGNYTYRILEAMRTDVRNRPTVDAAPVKHGYWIPSKYQHGMFVCSVCNDEWGAAAKMVPMLFCPTCGAKMDGGRG